MKYTPQTQNITRRHQSEVCERQNGAHRPDLAQHFQANQLAGNCGKPARFERPAFSDLSKDYFAAEEPRSFAVETAVFSVLVATALFPIVNGVQAVALLHTIGVL